MQQSCNSGYTTTVVVSILIRPEGRMQPGTELLPLFTQGEFQSSSGQKAGCNMRPSPKSNGWHRFQSSSGQKAGCNGVDFGDIVEGLAMFQSSSGQKAGCNTRWPAAEGPPEQVSILIRPEGRMQCWQPRNYHHR